MKRLIIGAIASLAILAGTIGTAAASASAQPVRQTVQTTTSCSTGHTCFYPQTNLQGGADAFLNSGSGGVWFYLPNPLLYTPDSAWEDGGSTLWLYSHTTGESVCIPANNWNNDLHRKYGYAYIKYGIPGGCGSIPTPLP